MAPSRTVTTPGAWLRLIALVAAAVLSLLAVCVALGRAVGAVTAQSIYGSGGMARTGIVSALCALVAAGLILRIDEPAENVDLRPA